MAKAGRIDHGNLAFKVRGICPDMALTQKETRNERNQIGLEDIHTEVIDMSGGSYNYLCHCSPEDLFCQTSDIQAMADRLAGLGYAVDAASEAEQLLLTVRQYYNRIDAMQERLNGVFRAVEWWDSADSGEDSVKSALDDYRRLM